VDNKIFKISLHGWNSEIECFVPRAQLVLIHVLKTSWSCTLILVTLSIIITLQEMIHMMWQSNEIFDSGMNLVIISYKIFKDQVFELSYALSYFFLPDFVMQRG